MRVHSRNRCGIHSHSMWSVLIGPEIWRSKVYIKREEKKRKIKNGMARRQGTIWLATIPQYGFTPWLPPDISYIKGQLECADSGFLNWQLVFHCTRKQSLRSVREQFGPWHFELTRSAAAEDYVWKEATRVEGTQFELGVKPMRRNSVTDWESVWSSAVTGDFGSIPADVRIRSYFALRAIRAEFLLPVGIIRTCNIYWGRSGTGKSRKAWERGGLESYPKDPRTKFWCGYSGQKNVIIDEFRGGIDIAHVLRWLDRYPVRVEIKGSSVPLCAEAFWITSNTHPSQWWPDLDAATLDAFYRRVTIEYFE